MRSSSAWNPTLLSASRHPLTSPFWVARSREKGCWDLRGASALLHHSVRVLGRLAGRERVLLLGTRWRAGCNGKANTWDRGRGAIKNHRVASTPRVSYPTCIRPLSTESTASHIRRPPAHSSPPARPGQRRQAGWHLPSLAHAGRGSTAHLAPLTPPRAPSPWRGLMGGSPRTTRAPAAA
eukprot:scaffold62093_cov49-Phaeocystis_antarctica.AAC.1